jgi:hypothetical protein
MLRWMHRVDSARRPASVHAFESLIRACELVERVP